MSLLLIPTCILRAKCVVSCGRSSPRPASSFRNLSSPKDDSHYKCTVHFEALLLRLLSVRITDVVMSLHKITVAFVVSMGGLTMAPGVVSYRTSLRDGVYYQK